MIKNIQKNSGQSLVELMVTIALASFLIPALLFGLLASREGRMQRDERQGANILLKETQEAVRSVRERSWSEISTNGVYHPVISGSIWTLQPSAETVNEYTRQIVISDVYRDAPGNIVQSGGTLDPSTKKVLSSVSWGALFSYSTISIAYFSRFENKNYTETTQAQFNTGTKTGVTITNDEGGEVILGAGGHGDWCNPNLSISSVDLPKQGVANAITAIQGQVFAGTGDNASGVSFAEVTISNTHPPVGTINGTFDGYKTNAVFGETNYAYLATDTNSKEIVIMDLRQKDSNNKFAEAGYFDAPGNGSGNSIFVSGNIGYMTSGNKLYTFDLTVKTGSRSTLGNVSLAGTGNKIVVVGNYAYVAIDSSTQQLQIIQIANNGQNLSIVGQASLTDQEGKDLFVNTTGTRAYEVTEHSDSNPEFFIIDTSVKTGNRSIMGSYNISTMNPKEVTVTTGNRAIIVGTGGQEYQVINIANESAPVSCGGLNIDTGVNGISTVIENDGDAYAYIITGDANAELKIIEGGPGGQYSSSGVFESNTFDASSEAGFNKFSVTANTPFSASMTYQISVEPAINSSCNNVVFNYVGPDLTSNTFFSTGSAIPFLTTGNGFKNPGRCMRYKAFLSTSDFTQTPVLYDINFNYSP